MAEIPPGPRLPPSMLSVAAVVESSGILPVAVVSDVVPGGWVIRLSAVVTSFAVAVCVGLKDAVSSVGVSCDKME